MGRGASGVKAMRIKKGDEIIGMNIISNSQTQTKNQNSKKDEKIKQYLLIVAENGFGKRTDLKEYRIQGRGGSGIKSMNVTPKTGEVVASRVLYDEEELIVISKRGQVIKTTIPTISILSRSTQGVRIMKLEIGDKVASVTCI